MGIAGIPRWTTDIGGFHGGDPKDPAFHELLGHWFQWGAFCPGHEAAWRPRAQVVVNWRRNAGFERQTKFSPAGPMWNKS
jgi:alpha-glucosidase (family GH31 glycosyl hydrolase)